MNFNFSNARSNKKNEDEEENYYKLLEVSKDASFEEIKKAYRRLSMIHHPDKNGNSEESTIKFKQLANAYETLSDEEKRMMYDMGIRNGNVPFDMNINPFDIFNMIFGSHAGQQQHQQQHQQQQHQQQQQQQHFHNFNDFGMSPGISSFINFGNGMSMPMSMPMPIHMPMHMPMGMGIHIIHPEQMESMPDNPFIPGFLQPQRKKQQQQQQQQQQHACDATTMNIYITLEDAYNGIEKHLVKMEEQQLYICIPQGVNDKEIIITTISNSQFSEMAQMAQIVHVIVNIKPHELFQRNGADLTHEKEISFKESLCGFEFSLKHLNGKTFHLQHKDGTIIKDGVSKRIHKLGMKDGNGGNGSLTISFKVVYPDKLSKEQIEKLSDIL